mmetsp:Transcript_11243/g.41167  ORF Transcript_11243/g.41167 Transcript_11243/m.41167 type:complete len:89 (-) Transcript_11243:3821-4087(-)
MTNTIFGLLKRKSFGAAGIDPKYEIVFKDTSPDIVADLDAVGRLAGKGLKPIMDPRSPFPFSEDGCVAMMDLMESHRAKGKAVCVVDA